MMRRKVTKKDQDSAAYRLSRIPQKYNINKVVKAETSESYAVSYYSNSAESPDLRSPQEKLDEVNAKLSGENNNKEEEEQQQEQEGQENEDSKENQQNDGKDKQGKQQGNDEEKDDEQAQKEEEEQRLVLLIQKKMLSTLVYGENSPEVVNATTELGAFYNQTNHPDSALRNLNKAQQQSKGVELEEADQFKLAVEYADASFKANTQSRQESVRNIQNGERILSPYGEFETDDNMLGYRRDLLLARIKNARNKHSEALPFYEKAADKFESINGSDKQEELGDFYVEVAQVAEKVEQKQQKEKEKEEQEAPPPEPAKSEPAKPEPTKPAKQEPAKQEPAKPAQKKQGILPDQFSNAVKPLTTNGKTTTSSTTTTTTESSQPVAEKENDKTEEEEQKQTEQEEKKDDIPKSQQYYQKAYDVYINAELNEKAEAIKDKLPEKVEEEETPEPEKKEEEEVVETPEPEKKEEETENQEPPPAEAEEQEAPPPETEEAKEEQ